MSVAWVVGRGGMLGHALVDVLRERGTHCFGGLPIPWREGPAAASDAVARATSVFADVAADADAWEIYWAAGLGTMGSPASSFEVETRALESLLAALATSTLDRSRGRIALASSAGAIYAGSSDPVVDEHSADAPTTPYAAAKLAHERSLSAFAASTGTPVLLARLSTLYGVSRAPGKQQGLLSHMARCIVEQKPIRIFVPLDTIRDYLAVEDAAARVVDALRVSSAGTPSLRIVASERPATIAEIIGVFRRLARRAPRIVTSGAPTTSLYTRRLQFRSIVPPSPARAERSLLVGASALLAAERLRYATGRE